MNTETQGLEEVTPFLNTAIVGIYVKFLGCTTHQVILRFLLAQLGQVPSLKFHAYILGKT